MSNSLLQTQVQQTQTQQTTEKQTDHSTYELKMFWRIRWYFAFLIGFVYLISAAVSLISFILTKNWYLLGGIAAPNILMPAIIYLVPMDEKRYQLKAKKIEMKAQKVQAKVQKQTTKRFSNGQAF
jgi:uncharacterized membrane protein